MPCNLLLVLRLQELQKFEFQNTDRGNPMCAVSHFTVRICSSVASEPLSRQSRNVTPRRKILSTLYGVCLDLRLAS